VDLFDRLRSIPAGTIGRLVYRQLRADDYVHDKFRVEILGVDEPSNVLRIKSQSGMPGAADAIPLGDIEELWTPDETPLIRVTGYMDFSAAQPYRYVSRTNVLPRPARTTETETMGSNVTAQVDDLNRRARRLLGFLHEYHLKVNGQLFRIGRCAETFDATGLDETTYMQTAQRLIDRGFAEWFASGGAIKVTPQGIRAAEDLDQLAYDLPVGDSASAPIGNESAMPKNSRKVFVVHGHDETAKLAVENFLRQLKLEPVVLHRQPNRGRTIIEKLEEEAEPVGYAVILLTPDDEGRTKGGLGMQDRARQNVLFEWGLFVGLLRRKHVCALYKGVELPSDLDGVLWIEMDIGNAWQQKLAKEMKAARVPFDAADALAH
jgi:predicted nucleotide-binding protein